MRRLHIIYNIFVVLAMLMVLPVSAQRTLTPKGGVNTKTTPQGKAVKVEPSYAWSIS